MMSWNNRCRALQKALKEADLVLLVLNASEPLTTQDRQLLEISQDTNRIILLNKTDLPEAIETSETSR